MSKQILKSTRGKSSKKPMAMLFPEDKKFQQVLTAGLALFLGVSLAVPFITVPEKSREELEKLPPQLTQFVLKEKLKPKPEPKPLKKVQEPKPKIEKKLPTPKKVQVAQEKPKPKLAPPPKLEKPPKPQVVKREKKRVIQATKQERAVAKAQAQKSGVLAMQAGLSSLVKRDITPKQAKTIGKVSNSRAQTNSAIAAVSSGGSGGTAASKVTGATLAEVGVQHTTKDLGDVQEGQTLADASRPDLGPSPTRQGQRDESAIRKVFERNKSAIYSIYARAQRKNEDLAGKLVLEIKIGADGRVASLKMINSELGDKKLERRIMTRVKMFTFGQEKVASLTMRYTFDFVAS